MINDSGLFFRATLSVLTSLSFKLTISVQEMFSYFKQTFFTYMQNSSLASFVWNRSTIHHGITILQSEQNK